MQKDGNFVVYSTAGAVIWATHTSDPSVTADYELCMQTDKNLVLYRLTPGQPNKYLWANHQSSHHAFTGYLQMQDDGMLVQYDSSDKALWSIPQGTYNLPDGTYSIKGGRDNKFCADENDQIVCNRNSVGGWEKFRLSKLSDSTYSFALQGGRNNQYCADEASKVICNRNSPGAWEKFRIEQQPDGTYGIKGGRNNQYCADEPSKMICNRGNVGGWEKFTISPA
jgi:hypothetical protein